MDWLFPKIAENGVVRLDILLMRRKSKIAREGQEGVGVNRTCKWDIELPSVQTERERECTRDEWERFTFSS